jgi:exopolysaccharide production protein ExoZ
MERKPKKTLLVNVQVLRAASVALITFVHLHNLFPGVEPQGIFYRIGYAAVDLFFLISGFIMVVTTSPQPPSALSFCLNRICRVIPLYYLATLIVFVVAQIEPSVFHTSEASLSDLVNSLLFIPFEKSPGRIYPLYFLGWTLNYEMFFYALFGAAIWLRPQRRVLLCSLVILAAVGAGTIASVTPQDSAVLYAFSQPIMLDFVLGMMIGHFYPALSRLGAAIDTRLAAAALMGLALLFFALISLPPGLAAPPTNTFVAFGIPMGCILLATVLLETGGYRVTSPLLLQSGNASYSLYLCHYFVIGAFVVANGWIDEPIAMAVIAFLVVWATGLVVYRTVEKPLIRLSKNAMSSVTSGSVPSVFAVDKHRRRIQAALVRLGGSSSR